MKSYLKLLRYLIPYRSLIFWFFIFSVLAVVFSLVSLIMLVPFLELLFDKTPLVTSAPELSISKDYFIQLFYFQLSEQIINNGKVSALAYFCVVVCIIFLLKNLFRYLALYVLAPLRNKLIQDLRSQLFEKLMQMPISFFKKNQKGDVITHFTSDLAEIEYSIMNTLETAIQSPLNIILFLLAMLSISPSLTGFVFGMILIMALLVGNIGKSLKKDSKNAKGLLGKMASLIEESYSGIKILRSFGAINWIQQRFESENKNLYKQYNKIYRKRDLSSPLTEFLAIVVVCIVLWYGGNLVLGGEGLSASYFISFMVIFSQLIPPAKSFSSAFYEIKKGMASYDRISTIIDSPTTQMKLSEVSNLINFNNSISFENVSFSFPDSAQQIISDFSYTFENGKKYAIVGPSGAGKSTILDLLLRFYEPTSGNIKVDSINIQSLQLSDYLEIFGLVAQEPVLFDHTVAENISLNTNWDEEKLHKALQTANAYDFVTKNIGIEGNFIGERGGKLSGGERQRLNIARVAYRNPKIILLDEATSALDSQNEQEVQLSLDNLLAGKTSIIIAHRLSTIMNADKILVMHEGRLVEEGNHAELIAKGGFYSKMVEMQQL